MDKVVISIIIAVLVVAILATVLVIIFKKVDLKKAISQTAELPDNFTYTAQDIFRAVWEFINIIH